MATQPTGRLGCEDFAGLAGAEVAFAQQREGVGILERASHLAIVQFFEEGHEQEEAQRLVEELTEADFQFAGMSLLVATRQMRNAYHRSEVRHSHACTNAIASAASSLAAVPAEVIPIYRGGLKIDSWLPFDDPHRVTEEGLTTYDIRDRDIAVSEAATHAYAGIIDPLLNTKTAGRLAAEKIALGIGGMRIHRHTSLIILTTDHDMGNLVDRATQQDHIETASIHGAALITDLARLQMVT